MLIGQRLKKLREEHDLRQEDLANIIKCSRTTIANYEQNKRTPSLDILCELADYFNVSLEYIVGRTSIKEKHYTSLIQFDLQSDNSIIFLLDPNNGRIIDFSKNAINFYGYSRQDLLTKRIWDLNPLPEKVLRKQINDSLYSFKELIYTKHKLANGDIVEVNILSSPVKIYNKTYLYLIIHKNSSHNYLEKQEFLQKLFSTLGSINEKNCPHKKNHSENVAKISFIIGKKLGLLDHKLINLKLAAQLHDIGEINVPNEILNKPTIINNLEYEFIKRHVLEGYEIITDKLNINDTIAKTILQHHEKMDGTGYPNGLTSDEIILEAKIITVADLIEAMSSDRPYRSAHDLNTILNELKKNKGTKYDTDVVNTCFELFKDPDFVKFLSE